MRNPEGPDFFIVGAPKCGTTSLNGYLQAHPMLFMAEKEQHYFGSDLAGEWPQPPLAEYFDSFAEHGGAERLGEASGLYLWSRKAAGEIHAYNPDARIIAAFRNPVDVLPSLHSQYVYDGIEHLRDLREALDAEDERRKRMSIPALKGGCPRRLLYREIVRFDEQLERYFRSFPRKQIHVVIFDDLVRDPAAVYRRLVEFLEVDPTFVPTFEVMNPNKRTRSRLLRSTSRAIADPSSWIRRLGQRVIPRRELRSAILRATVPALTRLHTATEPRPPLQPELRRALVAEFRPMVHALSELLGRDLTHWCSADSHAGHGG